ncbi:MAG TPA: dihydrofolate reductase [Candidatus Saccharimonadales bacterium]|nr:dihydrofolate reductase [Candidatus Saccharimonadales bacterium]
MIRFIAAIDNQNGLADDHGIPWQGKLPTDVAYFRRKIMDGTVVMGRGTYNELKRPLPGGRNLVATHKTVTLRKGFGVIHDVKAFLKAAKPEEDIWVIGGAELFESTLAFAEELYLTEVQGDFKCTKFFPEYKKNFELASRSEPRLENGITFTFNVYRHKV